MKNKTTVAKCAELIRKELKENFPQTKFSVKSSNYSMGNSVRVSWTDGAAENKVEELLTKYQYGGFNGQEDIYENTNWRDDISQTKYLFCDRKISDEIYLAKFEELKQTWEFLKDVNDINAHSGNLLSICGCWTVRHFIYQQAKGFRDVDFTKEEPRKQVENLKAEGLELVDYSEKAVALFGNTKEIKEKLKEIGGRFNPFLTKNGEKMAGWVFSKSKENELKLLIN
ncbi:MAG: hypothetical protein FJ368_06520 [Pelagibacterales bacterium]|nr:hypothetical protein [Pelagibacterales bacterium]